MCPSMPSLRVENIIVIADGKLRSDGVFKVRHPAWRLSYPRYPGTFIAWQVTAAPPFDTRPG